MYERDDDRTIMLIMTENRDDMRMGSGLYLSGMHSIVVTGQVGNTGTVHFRIFVVGWYLSYISEYLLLDGIFLFLLLPNICGWMVSSLFFYFGGVRDLPFHTLDDCLHKGRCQFNWTSSLPLQTGQFEVFLASFMSCVTFSAVWGLSRCMSRFRVLGENRKGAVLTGSVSGMPWCTCSSAVNSLHNCTWSARAVFL